MNTLPEDFLGRIIFILNKYGPTMLNGAKTTLIIATVPAAFTQLEAEASVGC